MPFYNFYPEIEIPHKETNIKSHPWEKCIKGSYTDTYKYGHNSAKNPILYPPPKKGKVPSPDRVQFKVVGTSIAREFIYCTNLVKGLHKYRWRHFDAPIIKAVTSVEWPREWIELKIRYGGEAYCLQSQVAVILNDQFIGGEQELKKLIASKYIYYITPDYYAEAVNRFSNYLNSSGRPCASLEIMIDDKEIGPLIFMLYSDIVPRTCENFLRLCKETRGGYAGTPIHRIVKDSWIQCGGFGLKKTNLDCENFIVPHDRRGVLAMANDGRHVDCSTQFFVLLQPQDWMAFKYVAFGQLISGEKTLKQIENVPEWYQSPKQNVIISKANILNFECQDISINKGTNKYLELHHENLLAIGAIFYEEVLQKVFLEAEFRSLQRIQAEMIELGAEATEFTPEEAASNLRTTQRFMRKKEEIDRQILERSQGDRSGKTTPVTNPYHPATVVDKAENNDFDVEEYEYEPEEYSYKQVSAPASSGTSAKPEKHYLIPFSDVPYPGEVTSEFDLKRLLQGHYCLESDIDQEAGKIKKKDVVDKLQHHPEKLQELFNISSESISVKSMNSDDERLITTYLKDNADECFAGDVIRNLARSTKLVNVFDPQNKTKFITDETLRKLRVAEEKFRLENEKEQIEHARFQQMHKEKKRRKQTGFVRPEDLARIRVQHSDRLDEDDEADYDDDDDEDDYQPFTRSMSIRESIKKVPEPVPVDLSVKPSDNILDEIEEETDERQKPEESKFEALRREHFVRRDVVIKVDEEVEDAKKRDSDNDVVLDSVSTLRHRNVQQKRPSGLTQLLDEVASYDHGHKPELKNYIPLSEQRQKSSHYLITFSAPKVPARLSSKISREMYLKRRYSVDWPGIQPIDKVLLLQHGLSVYRKMSTDYVRTIDHIEQKEEVSIRSLEYAKRRPSISVADYQKKNHEFRKNLILESQHCKETATKKPKNIC